MTQRAAEQLDPPGVRAHEPEEHPQQGRLAGAVEPEEAPHLPLLQLEIDGVDGADPIEAPRDALRGQRAHRGRDYKCRRAPGLSPAHPRPAAGSGGITRSM